MLKRTISILLILASLLSIFSLTGCSSNEEIKGNEYVPTDFNGKLQQYVENSSLKEENYMISPLSYRYVLAMATAGANGTTQEELLKATGFKTMDEYYEWAKKVDDFITLFDENANKLELAEQQYLPEGQTSNYVKPSLMLANSLWHISDSVGKIKPDYQDLIVSKFNAELFEIDSLNFADNANHWVSEKTNKMIPHLFDDAPSADLSTVLINTLYLKSGWENAFSKSATVKDKFTTVTGEKTDKDFMNTQYKVKYYEDKNSQLVILPLENGVSVAFVLGNANNVFDNISNAKIEEVKIKLPKMEIETEINSDILVKFLKENGGETPFSGNADFSNIIDGADINISNIIQKTKIITDEEGLEASAATAIMMDTNTSVPNEPEKIYEFIADKPFSFFIYENTTQELLFFGKMNK